MNPTLFAGPICTDFFCGGLGPILFILFYGPFLLIALFLLLAVIELAKSKDRRSVRKATVFFAVALAVIGIRAYVIYRNEHAFVAEDRELAEQINFTVYGPDYLPRGSKTQDILIFKPAPMLDPPVVNSSGNPDVPQGSGYPYLIMDYYTVRMNQFDLAPHNTIKRGNCGPDIPEGSSLSLYYRGDDDRRCEFIITTANGFDLYRGRLFGDWWYYATKGNTRIAVDSYSGVNEVRKVVEGLKPTDPTKLDFINK